MKLQWVNIIQIALRITITITIHLVVTIVWFAVYYINKFFSTQVWFWCTIGKSRKYSKLSYQATISCSLYIPTKWPWSSFFLVSESNPLNPMNLFAHSIVNFTCPPWLTNRWYLMSIDQYTILCSIRILLS